MRGAAWSLVLVLIAITASVEGESGYRVGCNIGPFEKVAASRADGSNEQSWTREECEDAGHCYSFAGPIKCYQKAMTIEQVLREEHECAMEEGEVMTMLDEDAITCWKKNHCFMPGVGCYRKRDDPCRQDVNNRVYLNTDWMKERCREAHACWGIEGKCYMKVTDMCFLNGTEPNYITEAMGEDHSQNEKICASANGCYNYEDKRCYLKNTTCIVRPDNCYIANEPVCEYGDNQLCGVAEQVEQWVCCEPHITDCNNVDYQTREFTIKVPCCTLACTNPAAVSAVNLLAKEDMAALPVIPFTSVRVLPSGVALLDDDTPVGKCGQTQDKCVDNRFHEHICRGRVYFLHFVKESLINTVRMRPGDMEMSIQRRFIA